MSQVIEHHDTARKIMNQFINQAFMMDIDDLPDGRYINDAVDEIEEILISHDYQGGTLRRNRVMSQEVKDILNELEITELFA